MLLLVQMVDGPGGPHGVHAAINVVVDFECGNGHVTHLLPNMVESLAEETTMKLPLVTQVAAQVNLLSPLFLFSTPSKDVLSSKKEDILFYKLECLKGFTPLRKTAPPHVNFACV